MFSPPLSFPPPLCFSLTFLRELHTHETEDETASWHLVSLLSLLSSCGTLSANFQPANQEALRCRFSHILLFPNPTCELQDPDLPCWGSHPKVKNRTRRLPENRSETAQKLTNSCIFDLFSHVPKTYFRPILAFRGFWVFWQRGASHS